MLVRLAVLAALALGACAAPDPAAELCKRGQECNLLGSGASEQGCTDYYHKCVDGLPTAEHDDWERMVDECLSNNSCTNFIHCFSQVPQCGTSN